MHWTIANGEGKSVQLPKWQVSGRGKYDQLRLFLVILKGPYLFPGPKHSLQPRVSANDVLIFLLLGVSAPLRLNLDGRGLHGEESSALSPTANRFLQDDDLASQLSVAFLFQVQIVGVFKKHFRFT